MTTSPNKFPGRCRFCQCRVAKTDGWFLKNFYGEPRGPVACQACVQEGAAGLSPDLPVNVHTAISQHLSSDPNDFVVWHNGRWVLALPFDWANTLFRSIEHVGGAS